jgi:hypothetical protein
VSDLSTKWRPADGSLALGAGVTLGTLSDNGYTFSGKLLLVIVFPGPILLIEGRANLLEERAKLGEQAMFRALAVLDGREGTFLLNVAARYKYGSNAELIDIRANAEAFFDFSDADAWHLYLGEKEPRERRIRAEIFQLFEANSYFMLDPRQLAMGAWVGYDKSGSSARCGSRSKPGSKGMSSSAGSRSTSRGLVAARQGGPQGLGLGFTSASTRSLPRTSSIRSTCSPASPSRSGCPAAERHQEDHRARMGPEGTCRLPMPLKEIAIEHFKTTASWPAAAGFSGRTGILMVTVRQRRAVTAPDLAALEPRCRRTALLSCRSTAGPTSRSDARSTTSRSSEPTSTSSCRRATDRRSGEERRPARSRICAAQIELHKLEEAWSLVARRSDSEAAVGNIYGSWAPVAGAGTNGIAQ